MLGSKYKCGSTGAGNRSTWRSSRPRSPPCCGKAPSLDDLPFCFDAGPHCATIKIGTSTDPALGVRILPFVAEWRGIWRAGGRVQNERVGWGERKRMGKKPLITDGRV